MSYKWKVYNSQGDGKISIRNLKQLLYKDLCIFICTKACVNEYDKNQIR